MPNPIQKFGTIATRVTVSVSTGAVVSKDVRVAVKGYFAAVERLRQAVPNGSDDPDEVYIALVDAVSWLTNIARAIDLGGNPDVRGVMFARHRSQHHLASITYFDEARGTQLWRPETQLPSDPHHENPEAQADLQRKARRQARARSLRPARLARTLSATLSCAAGTVPRRVSRRHV